MLLSEFNQKQEGIYQEMWDRYLQASKTPDIKADHRVIAALRFAPEVNDFLESISRKISNYLQWWTVVYDSSTVHTTLGTLIPSSGINPENIIDEIVEKSKLLLNEGKNMTIKSQWAIFSPDSSIIQWRAKEQDYMRILEWLKEVDGLNPAWWAHATISRFQWGIGLTPDIREKLDKISRDYVPLWLIKPVSVDIWYINLDQEKVELDIKESLEI